jgi:hypothetical protein
MLVDSGGQARGVDQQAGGVDQGALQMGYSLSSVNI